MYCIIVLDYSLHVYVQTSSQFSLYYTSLVFICMFIFYIILYMFVFILERTLTLHRLPSTKFSQLPSSVANLTAEVCNVDVSPVPREGAKAPAMAAPWHRLSEVRKFRRVALHIEIPRDGNVLPCANINCRISSQHILLLILILSNSYSCHILPI